jgi:hypothetical protein
VIAVAADREREQAVLAAWRAGGFAGFVTEVGGAPTAAAAMRAVS